ncbi:MAG: hypothetical protein FVQ81_01035 [Candidatus Glassbacteria bacterium]|nr:hypothetical protein [Candidatus Glassbacteria bacterium]
MNKLQFGVISVLLLALIGAVIWFAITNQPIVIVEGETKPPIVCPRGLPYSVCPNSEAMHGQIMVHNMTKKSFEVQVQHHKGMDYMENMHIQPGDGWSFTGILQGKRILIAKATVGSQIFESNCMVIGGTMHMMNINPSGIRMVDSMDNSGHTMNDLIKIPKWKKSMFDNGS